MVATRRPTKSAPVMAARQTTDVNGKPQWTSQYPTFAATIGILHDVLVTLGVTRYKFAQLVGNPRTQHVYDWFRGERRPSPMYLTRIVHLLILKQTGRLDMETFNPTAYWSRFAVPVDPVLPARVSRMRSRSASENSAISSRLARPHSS